MNVQGNPRDFKNWSVNIDHLPSEMQLLRDGHPHGPHVVPIKMKPWRPHQVAPEDAARGVPLLRLADDHRLPARLADEHRIAHRQAGHVLPRGEKHGETAQSLENLMFKGKIWENDVKMSTRSVYQ